MQRLTHFVPRLDQQSLSLEVIALVLLRYLTAVNHSSLIVAKSGRELGYGTEGCIDDLIERPQLTCFGCYGQVGGRQAVAKLANAPFFHSVP